MNTRKDVEFKAIASAIALLYRHRKQSKKLPKSWFQHLIGTLISAATELTPDSGGTVIRRKVYGQPYWSKEAIIQAIDNLKNKGNKLEKGLQHEHVIPKSYYYKKLERIRKPTQKHIHRLLETTVAAVVTVEEHKKLPKEYSGKNIWERYKGRAIIFDLSEYKTKREQLKLFRTRPFNFSDLKRISLSK
jgi:hypothetical protein